MTAQTEFIRMAVWEVKRSHFSDEDKQTLNEHICGQVVCPRGVLVAVNERTAPLLERLREMAA